MYQRESKSSGTRVPFFYWTGHWGGHLMGILCASFLIGIAILLLLDICNIGPALPIIYFIAYILIFVAYMGFSVYYLVVMIEGGSKKGDTVTVFALFMTGAVYTGLGALVTVVWTLVHESHFTGVSFYDDKKAYIGFIGLINNLFAGFVAFCLVSGIICVISYNLRLIYASIVMRAAPMKSQLGSI